MQSIKIDHLQGFCIIKLAISQSGPGYEFLSFTRARDCLPARLFFTRVKSPPVLAFSSQVAPPVLPAPHHPLQVPPRRFISGSTADHGDGVAYNRQWTAGGFCRDRWTIYGAKKVRIARGTGRRVRSAFCQAVRGLAYMPSLVSHLPSWPKCKLQMQNHWIPLFAIFGKLQEYKVQMQNPWRCSYGVYFAKKKK